MIRKTGRNKNIWIDNEDSSNDTNICRDLIPRFRCETMENLSNGQITVKVNGFSDNEIDLDFLPLIYEIIKSIERDPSHDTTQKPRESQDAAIKILELEKKLNQAREQINRLPGIDHSQEEQIKQVDNLRKQLALKRQLLSKYRNFCSFSVPK